MGGYIGDYYIGVSKRDTPRTIAHVSSGVFCLIRGF